MKTFLLNFLFTLLMVSGAEMRALAQETPKGASSGDAFKDPAALLDQLPKEIAKDMRPGSRNLQEAVAKANPLLSPKVKDKPCEVEAIVSSVDKRFEQGTTTVTGYTVFTQYQKIRAAGAVFYCYYAITFDKSEAEKVMRMRRGEKIRATGTCSGAGFMTGSQSPYFSIGVRDAKLK